MTCRSGWFFRNAILWHRGKPMKVQKIKELKIARTSSTSAMDFFCRLDDGSPLEASIEGIAPGVHELPYTKTDGSGYFPVSNASLARATVKLGHSETLETETGAALEMGGA